MMHYFGRLDSGLKITFLMVVMTIVSLGTLIYMVRVKVSAMILEQTHEYVQEASDTAGQKIDQTLEGSLLVARSLMASSQAIKDEKASRATLLEIHRQMLVANPNLLGTWSGWEPNQLDGMDETYANTKGHDATGRFIPYWVHTKSGMDLQPLVGYDKDGDGDYYQMAKKRMKETLLEPYSYDIEGEMVMMTTFSVPVIRNGKFVGVAGVDYSLADLQHEIQALKPMDEGRVGLVSSAGTWVVALNPADVGKAVSETEPELSSMMGADARVVKEVRVSAFNGDALTIVTPVQIGNTEQQWYVVVAVPMSVVTSPLAKLSSMLVGMGALAAVLMAVVCGLVVTAMLRQPLR